MGLLCTPEYYSDIHGMMGSWCIIMYLVLELIVLVGLAVHFLMEASSWVRYIELLPPLWGASEETYQGLYRGMCLSCFPSLVPIQLEKGAGKKATSLTSAIICRRRVHHHLRRREDKDIFQFGLKKQRNKNGKKKQKNTNNHFWRKNDHVGEEPG